MHYLSDTSCPVKIPGGTETLLAEDSKTLVSWLDAAHPVNKIFVDFSFHTLYGYLSKNYIVVDASPDGSMSMLVKI